MKKKVREHIETKCTKCHNCETWICGVGEPYARCNVPWNIKSDHVVVDESVVNLCVSKFGFWDLYE